MEVDEDRSPFKPYLKNTNSESNDDDDEGNYDEDGISETINTDDDDMEDGEFIPNVSDGSLASNDKFQGQMEEGQKSGSSSSPQDLHARDTMSWNTLIPVSGLEDERVPCIVVEENPKDISYKTIDVNSLVLDDQLD
ncbi:hypothetical protein L1887_27377 [Cichorium endivia]|nr:hypothetical protein L1887_27377 [Cichorium endivia]